MEINITPKILIDLAAAKNGSLSALAENSSSMQSIKLEGSFLLGGRNPCITEYFA